MPMLPLNGWPDAETHLSRSESVSFPDGQPDISRPRDSPAYLISIPMHVYYFVIEFYGLLFPPGARLTVAGQ